MKTPSTTCLAALIAIFVMLSASAAVHASCTGSNRVSLDNASCLFGDWENTCHSRIFGGCVSWGSTYWVQANVDCIQGTDKVVAKIDISGATDRTWHQTDFNVRTGSSNHKTNGVYCCSDLGRCTTQ